MFFLRKNLQKHSKFFSHTLTNIYSSIEVIHEIKRERKEHVNREYKKNMKKSNFEMVRSVNT
jgi:hypothetical protein